MLSTLSLALLVMWPVVGNGIIVSKTHVTPHHKFSIANPFQRPWCGHNQIPPYGCGQRPG